MTKNLITWDASKWTVPRLRLARAVRDATFRESPYAPMSRSLGPGNMLLRHVPRADWNVGVGNVPQIISADTALTLIKAAAASKDKDRFTGPMPGAESGRAGKKQPRGGMYCSADIRASIAELLHYTDGNLSRQLIGAPERLLPATGRCFISLRPTRELNVVNLGSGASGMLEFLARIEQDKQVAEALRAAKHVRGLFAAVFAVPPPGREYDLGGIDPEVLNDYSAARGLGMGLQDNSDIDGIEVLSARDFVARVGGGDEIMRTGDNVVLFGRSDEPASDVVRIQAIHLVDKVAGSHQLMITHYASAPDGSFAKTGSDPFTP